MRAEDEHRTVTADEDFSDERRQRAAAVRHIEPVPVDAAETAVADLRELAAAEAPPAAHGEEGRGRVASADETARAVERAQRALLELRARTDVERERAAQEARWIGQAHQHRLDHAAVDVDSAGSELVDG